MASTVQDGCPHTTTLTHGQLPFNPMRRAHVLAPITALAFFKTQSGRTLVLVGEDVWVKVYDVQTSEFMGQLQIFDEQPIHGIHISFPDEASGRSNIGVLFWGARLVAFLPATALDLPIVDGRARQPREFIAPDWIYCGSLSPYDPYRGALVTAHNEILPVSIGADGLTLKFGPLAAPSRPALYSAGLSWISEHSVLVAGGTVFGEIVVWKYHYSQQIESCEVLFVLTGHEGSIFGVSISGEIELAPGVKVRLLATCSDDRTIRIWDVTEGTGDVRAPLQKKHEEARETGFLPFTEAGVLLRADSARCLAVAMGHVSRIWHVRFSGRSNHYLPCQTPIEVFSFGEDGTRIAWKLSLTPERWRAAEAGAPATQELLADFLQNCGTVSCHVGRNIWSVAILETQDQDPLIVTGGADGKVAVLGGKGDAESVFNAPSERAPFTASNQHLHFLLDQVLASRGTPPDAGNEGLPQGKKGEQDVFKSYCFLSDDSLLFTTKFGRVLKGSLTGEPTWSEVPIPQRFRADLHSYNIVRSPAEGIAVLGAASGWLYIYEASKGLRELVKLGGKIAEIMPLGAHQPTFGALVGSGFSTFLVTIPGKDEVTIITVDASADVLQPLVCAFEPEQLSLVTAAEETNNWLVLGARTGAVAVYRRTANTFALLGQRRDTRTKEAVTSITPLPGSTCLFLATYRDGRYRIYAIREGGQTPPRLELLHEASPPLTVIEGARCITRSDNEIQLVLYGFKGNNFAAWDETAHQEIVSVDCGGAHRLYACRFGKQDAARMCIVYTKAGTMGLYRQSATRVRTLKPGGHGREMRDISSHGEFLATCSEDTTIRIWCCRGRDGRLLRSPQCLAVLEKHTAGVQCLRWFSHDGKLWLLSGSGNEELFLWRVSTLDSAYRGLAVSCEARMTDRSPDGDLRIVDCDLKPFRQGVEANGTEESGFLISLALSNSTIKTYLYTLGGDRQASFVLLAEGRYTGAALTQIRMLPREEASAPFQCLTTSTDGHLALWSAVLPCKPDGAEVPVKTELSLIGVTKLHQSTIKSLDMTVQPGALLIVTGGDDNALGLLELARGNSSSPELRVISKGRVKNAHAAAVAGVCILRQQTSRTVEIASMSSDQRVKVWRAETRRNKPVRITMLSDRYSAVADPGGLALIKFHDDAHGQIDALVIAGVGMEFWALL
ncbi:WD40 repeat-like protein [Thozetella sp. PMI_491]|nr:WD40 repeat-like protein [Thozetella sp. PMI_491]